MSHHQAENGGVRFNVETVKLGEKLQGRASSQSPYDFAMSSFYEERTLRLQVEANGFTMEHLVDQGGSLVNTALLAFAEHFPLVIAPDHVWLLISFALAKHVDMNAEALRSKFVAHQGKQVLRVRVDHFVLGGMPPSAWEADVFPDFSLQIREHIGEENHAVIAGSFSTTTPAAQAAHEITRMAAMKNYFSYKMRTMCGIPWIQLQGTEQDWVSLRERAAKVGQLMLPEFGSAWMKALLPVLDEFIAAFRGQVNHTFWQSMVKRVKHGSGSGSYTTISGWINVLYPYLGKNKTNKYALLPWEKLAQPDGPEPEDFPVALSSAPVEWDYLGTLIPLNFFAGMCGTIQDPDTLALLPRIGWMVTHAPPQSGPERISALEKEIADLTEEGNSYAIAKATDELKALKEGKTIAKDEWLFY